MLRARCSICTETIQDNAACCPCIFCHFKAKLITFTFLEFGVISLNVISLLIRGFAYHRIISLIGLDYFRRVVKSLSCYGNCSNFFKRLRAACCAQLVDFVFCWPQKLKRKCPFCHEREIELKHITCLDTGKYVTLTPVEVTVESFLTWLVCYPCVTPCQPCCLHQQCEKLLVRSHTKITVIIQWLFYCQT